MSTLLWTSQTPTTPPFTSNGRTLDIQSSKAPTDGRQSVVQSLMGVERLTPNHMGRTVTRCPCQHHAFHHALQFRSVFVVNERSGLPGLQSTLTSKHIHGRLKGHHQRPSAHPFHGPLGTRRSPTCGEHNGCVWAKGIRQRILFSFSECGLAELVKNVPGGHPQHALHFFDPCRQMASPIGLRGILPPWTCQSP